MFLVRWYFQIKYEKTRLVIKLVLSSKIVSESDTNFEIVLESDQSSEEKTSRKELEVTIEKKREEKENRE